MGSRLAIVLCALSVGSDAAAKDYDDLLDRIAGDAKDGQPIVVTIYVALCDMDSQGVVITKYPHMCKGEPNHNLYWTTKGGLKGYLDGNGWKRLAYDEPKTGPLAAKGIWKKRVAAGPGLRKRGAPEKVDFYIIGRAYRGPAIEEAVRDYLRAVGNDSAQIERVAGINLRTGGASHLVGFMGHDYFMDIDDPKPLLAEAKGDAKAHKGTFALSCLSDTYFRPALEQPTSHVLLLNTTLTYPTGWTVGGLLDGIIAGDSASATRDRAIRAFADKQGKSFEEARRQFAGE